MAMCWVYAGLTDEEAKVLALDHNIDSEFCLEMSFIQKIRFFHNEWVDTIKRDESPSHWCIHEGRVEEMSTFVIPRSYTLAIADAPYGFSAQNSVNDDVKYGVSAYKKVIEAFGKITTRDSWSLVFFHAHDQIIAAQKAFTNSNMTCQMLTWIKPNIHGYKLDRLSWACEFATIGFYSSLGVQSKGSYNFAMKPNCTNVFERPGVCKKFKHIGADVQGVINPYQKPQLLMMDLIDLLAMRGEWVMDLFVGTNTTTVSALKRGRNVIEEEDLPIQA
ncbi:hypothetical protein L7F22_033614 [Adiantum nelumboides]|nr:hypothetical protein [Adiantum nelumboides]